ncbi:MAG: hypothetical protein LQ342_000177 [Letrouitia transgressa]|nr:MAG: hypothetical protein LQ342_000177 [Letrouitia transgressa]
MLLPSVLSTAALAWTANAFLLPPENPTTLDKATHKSVIPSTLGDHKSQLVKLDCSSCPYALNSRRHGLNEWTQNVKSDLELQFTTEGNSLKLNGVPFYTVGARFAPVPLSAKQIKKSGLDGIGSKKLEGYNGNLRLSYSLEIQNVVRGEDGAATEILMTIMGLDTQMINVDDIKITLLALHGEKSNNEQELMIHSIGAVAPKFDAHAAKCTTILCRFTAKFASAIKSAKSRVKTAAHKVKCFCTKCIHAFARPFRHSGRPRPHHVTPHHRPAKGNNGQGVRLPTHNRIRPEQLQRPHTHHGGRIARPHGWMHSFSVGAKRILSYLVLPILLGVVFGLAASAIGMLVGHIVVLVWLKLRRGKTSSQVAYHKVETEEKEPLPKYEDLDDITEAMPQEKV